MDVSLFEAGPHTGGMARSFDLWGSKVDLGPHRFFSKDPHVNQFWQKWVGREYHHVDRLTRIFYNGKFYDYPLKAFNALRNMGPVEAGHCMTSYILQKLRAQPAGTDATFEDWVTRRFGSRLYSMFFKTYSEKLWGIPCDKLDADFAAQRIKKFSLGEAVLKATGLSRQRHATLIDRFTYPDNGCGAPYERMAAAFLDRGGRLALNIPVKRVLHTNHTVHGLELLDGHTERFDHVVSTMPLTALMRGLEGLPPAVAAAASQLGYRNTILVYLRLEGENLFPDQWLYIHEASLKTGRITNFNNWGLSSVPGQTILALEYWCDDADPLWTAEDAPLIDRAMREVTLTGLTKGAAITAGHVVRIHRCYPIYRCGYQQHLKVLTDHLRQFSGLSVIGRYGAFKYNNQDHSILMGLLCAENLLADNPAHDLWSINTDYEYHEEAEAHAHA